jgi:hypothetical protein
MRRLIVVLMLGWSFIVVNPAAGQGFWTEASMLGYGALGLAAGVAVCGSCDYDAAGGVIGTGAALGIFAGYHIGRSAETVGRRGVWPSGAQLLGARIGMVTGVAALGSLAAAYYISNYDSGKAGEDERNLARSIAAGAVVGVVLEVLEERKLKGRLMPRLDVGYGRELGPTVGLRLSLP